MAVYVDNQMVLAFFLECSCPPHMRGATVGGGGLESVDEFFNSYPLTRIVCDTCGHYYRLIGYIDEEGTEHRVETPNSGASSIERRRHRALPRLRRATA